MSSHLYLIECSGLRCWRIKSSKFNVETPQTKSSFLRKFRFLHPRCRERCHSCQSLRQSCGLDKPLR